MGVLYIIGTGAGIASAVVMGPFSSALNPLQWVSDNPHRTQFGALLVMAMSLSLALVAVFMFPILRRHNETLAIGYVVFRGALEQILTLATSIYWLVLVVIAGQYANSAMGDASQFHFLGSLTTNSVSPVASIVFSIGAWILYYLFYQTRLIPRWISGFGLLCVVGYVAAALSAMFGTNREFLMYPMALQEMIMAVWLIAKGFNSGTVPSEKSRQPISI